MSSANNETSAALARHRERIEDGTLFDLPDEEFTRALLAVVGIAESALRSNATMARTIDQLQEAVRLLESRVKLQAEQIAMLRKSGERSHDAMQRFCDQQGITSGRAS